MQNQIENKEIGIKIELLGEGKVPSKAHEGDVGFDCYIEEFKTIKSKERQLRPYPHFKYILLPSERVACKLGFKTKIPEGYYAQLVPRSGLALWEGLTILNTPATIDPNYRGEWLAIVQNNSNNHSTLEIGDRICQLIIRKKTDSSFKAVSSLEETKRNEGGFGSSGRK